MFYETPLNYIKLPILFDTSLSVYVIFNKLVKIIKNLFIEIMSLYSEWNKMLTNEGFKISKAGIALLQLRYI